MALLVGALALVAAACSDDGNDSTGGDDEPADEQSVDAVDASADFAYPDPDFVTADPASKDVDPEAIQALSDLAAAHDSHCLVVTRDGELVHEEYWGDWDETSQGELFSATKSFTSALFGIAQDQGLLDISEPASTYLTEWQGTDSEDVTIRNLLSNDSGREWDFTTDYLDMAAQAEDKTALSVGLGQELEPGTEWEYNNAAIQTLDAVFEGATGEDLAAFAEENLFGPLGMSSSEMGHDASGNTITFFNMKSSCLDLARFGNLFLRDGEWADGEQIVSAEWVEESTTPSTDLNSGYGYLWWLNVEGDWVEPSSPTDKPSGSGIRIDGVSEDVFMASGLAGQRVNVYPSKGLVVTRIGPGNLSDSEESTADDFSYEITRRGEALVAG